MKRLVLTVGFLILLTGFSNAQAPSPLSLVIDNQTYFYNQERGRELDIDLQTSGFTLTGNLFRPVIRYDVRKRIRIEVGALIDLPFGDDDRVEEVDPVISLHFGLWSGWMLTVGTIDRNHPLHDAFFDDLLRYQEPIEQGFQLKAETQHLRQDAWVSWEERETTSRREKFSVGNYTQLKAGGFMVDGQLYWVHLGGQNNSGPGVFNNWSIGLGTGYTYHAGGMNPVFGFLQEIGATVHYLQNFDDPPNAPRVDEEGVAVRGFVTAWNYYIYYLHWRGGSNNFNSPRGDTAMPNVPLAKGDPLYRARIFDEVGISRTWELSDEVNLTANFRAQWLKGRFANITMFNMTWRPQFPLFEDYFKTRTEPKPEPLDPPYGRPYGF